MHHFQILALQACRWSCFVLQYIMKSENSNHQLRISIDLRALKDHEFTAQLSLRYKANPSLGLPAFRSASVAVPNPRVEVPLRDCFQSGYFQSSSGEIAGRLAQSVEVELWHTDRLKSDTQLGRVRVQLEKLMEMPLRSTSESFARVLDAYLPVDEVSETGRALKTIGSLRVIAYLEDLGPVGQLQERGFNIREFLEQVQEVPRQEDQFSQAQRAVPEAAGLNQLQRKVVWELQTWKKAEETKARLTLKQKEIEFWTNISEQQRKSDLEKEKQFKKIEAGLTLLEGKLRGKLAELTKRQQKLLTFEQELQTKIVEVSRECLAKDQEIETLKRRHKEDKTAVIKEKAQVEVELAKMRAESARLRVEVQELRKQDDKSPLNILKSELNARNLEIKELSRELEKANDVKEEYKIYYGKMKEEVISLKDRLKAQDQALNELRRVKELAENNYAHVQKQLLYERQLYQQQQYVMRAPQHEEWDDQEHIPNDKLGRLVLQRETLLKDGVYNTHDPLIMEIDRQIREIS